MEATILIGITGVGKTFTLNNKLNHEESYIVKFNRSWSDKSELEQCIKDKRNIIIDNKGLNVEQAYKCIRDLQTNGYYVKLLYVKSNFNDIKIRTNNNIIYDEYETLESSLEILSNVANEIQVINNIIL